MKKILIATLTPLLLTVPLMTVLPSLAEKPGGIIAQADSSIRQMAQGFTVKILVGDTNGSGVIIGKMGNTYRVVTNAHVVTRSKSYKIQAPDGKIYAGKLLEKGSSLQGNDLAILAFESSVNYAVATLAEGATLKPNDAVYSAGFPIDQSNFVITSGMITEVTSQPLKGGYQLGYSADTLQGMSGGPLLNSAGQLVGIVGMGKGAALLEAYTYQDESRPAKDVISQWRGMSFAVPVATINQIVGDVAKVPSGDGQAVPKARNYTGIVKKVDDIAQQVTVRIDAPNGENGSGTIIGKEGNTYSVLTACHVVARGCKAENLMKEWEITLPDGEKLMVKSGQETVTILNPDIDVAVIRFNSAKNYAVATLGNYTTQNRQWLFMTGFPGKEQSKQRLLTAGTVWSKDRAAFETTYTFSTEDGQELVYTNQSSGGMSGGGVFDMEGRLVGVNTASEDEILEGKEVSWGYSLGVPITAFLGIAKTAKFSTKSFPQVTKPAVEVNTNEIQQIEAQLFRFEMPPAGATVADWVNYGNALWRVGENVKAVQAFDLAITLLGKEEKSENLANVYYTKGVSLAHNNQYAEALIAFQQATKNLPQFPNAWRLQGRMLANLQRYSDALIAYEKAINTETHEKNKNFVFYIERGDILRELKRYSEALASYEQAIKLKPNHPWTYNNRGLVYYKKGEKNLALKDYNYAISLNPQDEIVYNNRGIIYQEKGNNKLALKDYNYAISLNSKFASAYNNRGLLYRKKGESELALKDYNQAIQIDSKLAEAYLNRGELYSTKGKKELALQDYKQAIQINSQYVDVYFNRALLYETMKEEELAIQDYKQAIQINPKFAKAYFNRALLYEAMKEKELAIQDFKAAAKLYYKQREFGIYKTTLKFIKELGQEPDSLNPQFAEDYLNRGLFYKKEGESELALKDYNQAIQIDSKLAEAYLNRGELYSEKGEKELALKDYSQAIQINPEFTLAYFKRALFYETIKEKELALKDYSQAIQLDPEFALAYFNRANLYLEINRRQQAIQDFKAAAKLYHELEYSSLNEVILEILKTLGEKPDF